MITVEHSLHSYDASDDSATNPLVQEGSSPVDNKFNGRLLRNIFDSSKNTSRLTPKNTDIQCITINKLLNLQLQSPLDIIIEPDDNGFIARMPDLPLYAFDDDPVEAIESLKFEIESLYNDLMEDDEFTEEWLSIKVFLSNKVKNV
jgi:hypothetical protein